MANEPTYGVHFGPKTIKVRHRPGQSDLKKVVPLAELGRATKAGRFWQAPYPDVTAVIKWARDNNLTIDPAVESYAEHLWVSELNALTNSSATRLPDGATMVPVTGLVTTPLATQEVAINMAATCWRTNPGHDDKSHRALLIADEPGLGKSIMALAATRITGIESSKVLIVCPTSLTGNWQAEMLQHFEVGTFTPWVATSITAVPPPGEVDAVIIGWEILSEWATVLTEWGPDALVVDEGHYAKSGKQRFKKEMKAVVDENGNPVRDSRGKPKMQEQATKAVSGSARASAVLDLATGVEKRHGLILALTGTPIVNRPVELAPLLELTGILNLWGSKDRYQHRHCGPKQVSIGQGRTRWNFQGASNLLELNTRLRASGHYVRRTKQVLIDAGVMKPKYVDKVFTFDYQSRPRPWIIRASEAEMVEYRACEDDNADFFQERAREIARDIGAGVNTVKVRQKIEAEGSGPKHLKRIIELRQEAAKVKVPYVVKTVQELVDRGEKVVIAAYHREIVDAYADAFTGLKIQGSMGVKAIEEVKRLFNETPVTEHPVLVLSVEAGKTGHTLCKQALHGVGPACAYMIFAEQIWTPGDEAQAQDRIWRIGQDREVRISNAVLAGSIDEQMFWQRVKKKQVVNAAIDAVGDPSDRDDTDAEKKGRGQLVGMLAYRASSGQQQQPRQVERLL